jgi:hypothetical protein
MVVADGQPMYRPQPNRRTRRHRVTFYDRRMTTDAQPTPAPPATTTSITPVAPREDVADALELLGLVAQLEHTAFVRLAADSAIAPTVDQRLALSRFAAAAVERRDRVIARIEELGADVTATLAPFDDVLDEFDARTQPSSWWERLLKAYVGYGVADDFCRMAAQGLDERSRTVVLEVLEDASHAELAVAELDAAGSQDDALASRLALWGRRLVGEALSVVQRLVAQRPGLARLARAGAEPEAAASGQGSGQAVATEVQASTNVPTKVFGELTAQHTRRMGRLGLTP